MSEYLREFGKEWRALTAATIGLSSGLVLNSYAIGIMGPHLVEHFGWERSQMAAVQILALLTVISFPIVGRLADVIGGRRTALIGIIASPVLFFGFSQVTSYAMFAVLYGLQVALLTTTTPPIYFRVIVQNFRKARGMALAISVAGPSLVAAVGGPLLNNLVVAQGWQAGYIALMIFTVIGGLLAFILMPSEMRDSPAQQRKRPAKEDFALILRSRVFWIIGISMLLCNLPQAIFLSQLNLIIAEFGVVDRAASIMVSSYAVGMMIGRFISGFALDRFPARMVASFGLALSAIGLIAIGFFGGSPVLLSIAVLAIGLSFGAESDIIAYLIYRHFGSRIYSSVHGMTSSIVAISSVLGAGLVALILHLTDTYWPFLLGTGVAVLTGAALLLFLPANGIEEDEGESEETPHGAARRAPKPATA